MSHPDFKRAWGEEKMLYPRSFGDYMESLLEVL